MSDIFEGLPILSQKSVQLLKRTIFFTIPTFN